MQDDILSPRPRRALVTGHFSTVGDIEVLDQVTARLARRGIPFDITPLSQNRVSQDPNWVAVASLDPTRFSHLLVVCGPYAPDYPAEYPEVLGAFRHCTHVGINLTMVAPLDQCQPFDGLIERDSDRITRPDLSLLSPAGDVPVVGICLVARQREYGDRQQHDVAATRLRDVARRAGVAVVDLDTALPRRANRAGIGTAAEFESILSRLDAVLTNRLHGMVLSLKRGVPVLAVDAIAGGDKVTRQARHLGWTEVHRLDQVSDDDLLAALRRCLEPEARDRARAAAARGAEALADFDRLLDDALDALPDPARRPSVAPKRGRMSRLAARYRTWKRRRFPKRAPDDRR